MLSSRVDRVPGHTSEAVNAAIRRRMHARVERCAAGGPAEIARRLAELDREWDVERCLETVAPSLTLLGLGLGLAGRRRWLAVPIVVQAFFLQHALQGWCPPLPVLRRLGVRTVEEIDEERYALMALRGDFQGVRDDPHPVERALRTVRHGNGVA